MKPGDQPGSPSWCHHISAELQEAAGPRLAPTDMFCPGAACTTGLHPGGSCCLVTWDAAPLLRKTRPFLSKAGDSNPWPSEGDFWGGPQLHDQPPHTSHKKEVLPAVQIVHTYNQKLISPRSTRHSKVRSAEHLLGNIIFHLPTEPPYTRSSASIFRSNRRHQKKE